MSEKIKFFVDASPDFCRIPHPNRRGGTLPDMLEARNFSSLGWDACKRIYLPATDKFPEAPHILEEEQSPRVKRARIAVAGNRRVRGQAGAKTRPFDHEIDEFTREVLLEQGRGRFERKMLPWIGLFSATYHGTDEYPFTVICEAVTGHRTVAGSYITIQPWQKRSEKAIAEYARQTVGAGRSVMQPVWTLEQMLEQAYPEFPWHHNYTRSFLGKRFK